MTAKFRGLKQHYFIIPSGFCGSGIWEKLSWQFWPPHCDNGYIWNIWGLVRHLCLHVISRPLCIGYCKFSCGMVASWQFRVPEQVFSPTSKKPPQGHMHQFHHSHRIQVGSIDLTFWWLEGQHLNMSAWRYYCSHLWKIYIYHNYFSP